MRCKLQPLLWAYSILDAIWIILYGDAVVRLLANPTMVAAFQLMRKGNDPVPRDDLDLLANFLYMLNEQEPDPLAARIFDVCLTLHAEHTMNATFSASDGFYSY